MNGTSRRENCLRIAENRRNARSRRVMQRIVTVINRGEDPASWSPFQFFVRPQDLSAANKSTCLSRSVYYRLAKDPNWSWDWEWLLSDPLREFDPFAYFKLQEIRAGEPLSDDAWSEFAHRYRAVFVASERGAGDEQDLASAVAGAGNLALEKPVVFLSRSPGPNAGAPSVMAELRWVDYYLLAVTHLVQRRGSAAEHEPSQQDWELAARTAAEGWQVVEVAERAGQVKAKLRAGSGRGGLAWEWAYCLARAGIGHDEIQRIVAGAARDCFEPEAMIRTVVAVALLDRAYDDNAHTRQKIAELSGQIVALERMTAHHRTASSDKRKLISQQKQLRVTLQKMHTALDRAESDAARQVELLIAGIPERDSAGNLHAHLLDLRATLDEAACRYRFARHLRMDWSDFSCATGQLPDDDLFHQAATRRFATQVTLFWMRSEDRGEREAATKLLINWTVEEFRDIGGDVPAPSVLHVAPSVVEAVLTLHAEEGNIEEIRNILERLRLLLACPQSGRWPRVERAEWERIINRFRDYLRPPINIAPARHAIRKLSKAFQRPGTLRSEDLAALGELHEELMMLRAQAVVSLELKVDDRTVIIPGDRLAATKGLPVSEWCDHGHRCALERLASLEEERHHFKVPPTLQG